MKPKDLILPHREEKEVLLDRDECIFFAPPRTNRAGPPLVLETLFEHKAPIHLEFCSGNGEWICQKALQHPEYNWIALEIRFDRVRKIWSKLKNRGIGNLFIVCCEALDFTTHFLGAESIDHVSVNFPDPWPKRKHAKNRLIQAPFLDQVARILKPGGEIQTLTDDPHYFKQISSCLVEHESFISLIPSPYYTHPEENYGTSYFMNLWKEKKRSFYFSKFMKGVQS